VDEASWFAGARVAGARRISDTENEQFAEFVRGIRSEFVVSYLFLLVAVVLAVVAANINIALDWPSLMVFSVTMGILRYLPQRRFLSPVTLLRLQRDVADRMVWHCHSDNLSIEVLQHSQFVWRRNGLPLAPPLRVREARTALPPPHAAMAADFVRPLPGREEILIHQRALSDGEKRELDARVPPPSFFSTTLTVVAAGGAVWSYFEAAQGATQTLLPAFVLSFASFFAARFTYRKYAARKKLERDLETSVVLIVRARDDEATTGSEFLSASGVPWTENGVPAVWRTH
jgi:hypothetical protein